MPLKRKQKQKQPDEVLVFVNGAPYLGPLVVLYGDPEDPEEVHALWDLPTALDRIAFVDTLMMLSSRLFAETILRLQDLDPSPLPHLRSQSDREEIL